MTSYKKLSAIYKIDVIFYLLVPVMRNVLGSSDCIAAINAGNSSSGTTLRVCVGKDNIT